MTEKQLLKQVRKLRDIKPRHDWVLLTKDRIFEHKEEAETPSFLFLLRERLQLVLQHKPACAVIVALVVIIGTFGFAQRSLPGDALYPVRRMSEKSNVLVSRESQTQQTIDQANRRLNDVAKAAEKKAEKNLAPAITEFQESVSEIARNLAEAGDKNTVREIVREVQKLEEKAEEVSVLGVEVGVNEELDTVLRDILERELAVFEGKELSEEQQGILEEVTVLYKEGSYTAALEKLLMGQ